MRTCVVPTVRLEQLGGGGGGSSGRHSSLPQRLTPPKTRATLSFWASEDDGKRQSNKAPAAVIARAIFGNRGQEISTSIGGSHDFFACT